MNLPLSLPAVRRAFLLAFAFAALPALIGCRTGPPLPPANFSEPGWRVQQGQAVWKARASAPEIAGEILLATHPDGRAVVQFTKTPFPIVVAQSAPNRWEIQFVPEGRTFRGRGQPPSYFSWLQLPPALASHPLPKAFSFSPAGTDASPWRLENRGSGEWIEGYLSP